MVLNISFNPVTEAKLRQQAQDAGKPIEQLVREAVESRFGIDSKTLESSEERLRLWKQWVESHPRRAGVNLDDSRDSIYSER
jgi:hypothetical protein